MLNKLVIRAAIDARQLASVRELIDVKPYRKLMISSLNEAGRRGRMIITREVKAELAMTTADVKKTIGKPLIGVASGDNPFVRITVKRDKQPMKQFAPRRTARGVSVKIRKREGRHLLRGAFLVGKWESHVFKRTGRNRGPVEMKFGPTVAGVLGNKPGMADDVADEMAALAHTRFASKLELYLAGKFSRTQRKFRI